MKKTIIFAIASILFSGCGDGIDIDIHLDGDIGTYIPAEVETKEQDDWIPETRGLTIFLNIEGGELTHGDCGNPQNNVSCIKNTDGPFPPFDGNEEYVQEIIENLEAIFDEYDVSITTKRPQEQNYVMAVLSKQTLYNDVRKEKGLKSIGGVSPLDCGNVRQSDTVHIFYSSLDSTPLKVAQVVAHEVGHSLGFGHVVEDSAIMYNRSGLLWLDACVEITQHHCERKVWTFCPEGYTNMHKELLGLLGPSKK